jgi:hypothetical protein
VRHKILFVVTVAGFFFAAMFVPAVPLHASPSAAQAAASSPCDRSCLNGFVDQYIDALVAHDPSRLVVTKFVKYTENGQHIELGDGFWRTATGKGGYKFYVDDPEAGQVGFEGTMQEAGHPVIVALRLKIENQKISEIETIVARGGMAQISISSPNRAQDLRKRFRRLSACLASISSEPPTSIFRACKRMTARATIRSSATTAIASRTACRPRTI